MRGKLTPNQKLGQARTGLILIPLLYLYCTTRRRICTLVVNRSKPSYSSALAFVEKWNTGVHLLQCKLHYTAKCVCVCVNENRRLTLANDAGQSDLELVFGLFHLLLMLSLLARQPADVAVGGLDHGVEVVGVPSVDFPSFQPGHEHAHRFRKLPVLWPRGEDKENKSDSKQ